MEKKDIALRIARLREKKGVSARDMSLSIGQNEGYINNIETGKSNPSLDGLLYICEYLGVTLCEFFDLESTNPSKLNSIVMDMKKLNDQQLDTIAALVRDLAKKCDISATQMTQKMLRLRRKLKAFLEEKGVVL